MDLDGVVDDFDEPTIGDSGTRIEAELVVAIRAVRGLRDLDDEGSGRGMRVTIVAIPPPSRNGYTGGAAMWTVPPARR